MDWDAKQDGDRKPESKLSWTAAALVVLGIAAVVASFLIFSRRN